MRSVFIFLLYALLVSCAPGTSDGEKESSPPESFEPKIQYNMVVNDLCAEQGIVQKNQQFVDLLQGRPVSPKAIRRLNTLSKKEFDFRTIRAGNRYTTFVHEYSDSVHAVVLEHDPVRYTIFYFSDSLRIERCENPVVVSQKSASGVIESNLSETIEKLGVSNALTNRFVDIFAWQVDFYHLLKGDHFKILYEELSVNDKPYGIGKILGISFTHNNKKRITVPFDQGKGVDYFDSDGNSLRKALLKYPIEFTRISSRYTLNRFHPVLKISRAHLGTDLAAPAGTPIRSVGDGVVVEAGYKGGNGNYVTIRHNSTYTTGYLHMSRIGSGIRRGVNVRQGEVIGYVGSTGWATGPHLCYRFWKNGTQVDALRVELPAAEPVRTDMRGLYSATMDSVRMMLSKIPDAQ